MANTLVTPQIIAKEALFHLENNLLMGNLVHRAYEKEFKKVGDYILVRKPVKFTVTKSATRSNQDVVEETVTVNLNTQAHVSWNFTSAQLTMKVEDYRERYIKPACEQLAQAIDEDLCNLYKDVYHVEGNPSNAIDAYADIVNVSAHADKLAIPDDGRRYLVLTPDAKWALASGLTPNIFVEKFVEDALKNGALGTVGSWKIFGSSNIKYHDSTSGSDYSGSFGGNASEGGSTVNVANIGTTDTIYQGSILQCGTSNWVNPLSKADIAEDTTLVLTANATMSGGANTSVAIAPVMRATGARQNMTSLPASGETFTIVGDHWANLAFHKNAFALCVAPLEIPEGTWGSRITHKGLSIRVVKHYDIDNDLEVIRLDVLYGCTTIYPELAIRVVGGA